MARIIPKNTKVRMTFYKGVTIPDIIIGFIGLVLIAIAFSSNLAFRALIGGAIFVAFVPLYITINGDRLYLVIAYFFKHLVCKKKYSKAKGEIEDVIPYQSVNADGIIELKDLRFAGVVEVSPVDFRMMDEFSQAQMMDAGLGRVLNSIAYGQEIDIVKIERPLILDNFMTDEMQRVIDIIDSSERRELTKLEYEARVDVIQDRMLTIEAMNTDDKILYSRYYLVFHSGSQKELSSLMYRAVAMLQNAGVGARLLNQKETVAFIRYTTDSEFDERVLQKVKNYRPFFMPQELKFGFTSTAQDGKVLTHFVINNYPLRVCNGWGEGLFDIPNTKVVMKVNPVEKYKAVRRIDNAILELQTQTLKNRASDEIEKDTHLQSLQDLLVNLQNENDVLFDVTLIITAYDEKGKNFVKKLVRRRLREMGFGFNEMVGRQKDVYLTSQVCTIDKVKLSRGIPTSSLAAVFPFVSNAIVDDKGLLIGENKLPVFVDFNKRDDSHLSSNMIVLGKPGSGKSYAC